MPDSHRHILIIADIEGCSGCWSYEGSKMFGREWAAACLAMSRDVDAAVRGAFSGGAETVAVKDFHRTGYNVLPEHVDSRARIVHGYRRGPVPGLGDPGPARALMFVGLHAAAGTDGFLAHTLTSRIARLEVNGRALTEAELFSASLAPYGVRPVLFSGDHTACRQAADRIPGIMTYAIDKSGGPGGVDVSSWRAGLERAAAGAAGNHDTSPFEPEGPFRAEVVMRDGEAPAEKIEGRWGYRRRGDTLFVEAPDIHGLYMKLIRLAYLTPMIDRITPAALGLYNAWGRLGMAWVRRRLNRAFGSSDGERPG